jgi:thiamine kinase-like enzyme
MCHLDFNQRNVILDEGGKVWLIDLGLAGAYPPWFEEARLAWGASSSWELGLLNLVRKEMYREDVAKLVDISFALTTGGYCQPRARVENKQ